MIALLLPLLRLFPTATSLALFGIANGELLRSAIHHRTRAFPTGVLLACMLLPLAWMLGVRDISFFRLDSFWLLAGLPGICEVAVLSALLQTNFNDLAWVLIVVTSLKVFAGRVLIAVSPKWSIAYFALISLNNWVGSLGMYMLYRA